MIVIERVVVPWMLLTLDRSGVCSIGYGRKMEGFTPVQRRLSTISARQVQGDIEKEWTAARCNRLLRTLQSRVAILNKDVSRMRTSSQGRGIVGVVKATSVQEADHDNEWSQARKKVKHTYSTRQCKGNHHARGFQRIRKLQTETRPCVPGEISVPTPILNRAREYVSTDPAMISCFGIERENLRPSKRLKVNGIQSKFQFSHTMRDIRRKIPATRYAIYEGICSGLVTLLKATNPEESQKDGTGSKSLLSLCLIAVPRYIAQEEELFKDHMEKTKTKSAINNRDISIEVYDDLEAFGCNGKGWRHFKTIVRSHGIQLICDSIRAGLLDTDFIGMLIMQCIHTKATAEARVLLSTLLMTAIFPEPKSVFTRFDDEPATQPLSMLLEFVESTGFLSFHYQQLSTLISTGLLPLSWLATKEFGPIWTGLFQVLPMASNNQDALLFLDAVLPLLARADSMLPGEECSVRSDSLMLDAVKQTFSSLLTTLSAIAILSGDIVKSQDRNSRMCTTEHGHCVTLVRSCLMKYELSHISNIQGSLLIITNLVLKEVVDHEKPSSDLDLIDPFFNHLSHVGKSSSILPSNHEIVSFLCSIARCCGRGASNPGFEYLKMLHKKLESFICDRRSESANIVNELLADSALAFAQDIPDREHLDYADVMEAKVHRVETKSMMSLTPGRCPDSLKIGFRWEEGISEWVTATPFIRTSKCHDMTKFRQSPQMGRDKPLRPKIQRQPKKPGFPVVTNRDPPCSGFTHATSSRYGSIKSSRASSPISGCDDDHDCNGIFAENESVDYYDSEDDLVSHGSSAHSVYNFRFTSEEQSTEPTEPDHNYPTDELQPSSSRRAYLTRSEQASSPHIEDSFVDIFCSSLSSAESDRSGKASIGRRPIDRVPRLSRRVLRRSLQWQLFDDDASGDELSLISISSEGSSMLQDITNIGAPRTRRQQEIKFATKGNSVRHLGGHSLGESEDELCF